MGRPAHVLLIEDNDGDAVLVQAALSDGAQVDDVQRAIHLSEGVALAATMVHDVVLLDLGLPDSSGLATVERAVAELPPIPIVVLTGSDDEQLAEQALHLGAQDYLVKDQVDPAGLDRVLRYARERHGVMRVLQATNEELDRANRIKDDFIAIASHELRTPVTVINGALETLFDRWDLLDPTRQQDMLRALRTQADRLVALVEDLLVLSRIERGVLAPTLEPVDLEEVVVEAVASSHAAVDEVEVHVPPIPVRTDREYLVRILVNLLENAVKYGAPPIEVDLVVVDHGLALSVRDHGPGIDPEFREQLFEQFTRSHAPEVRRQPGTGLGLAIVRALGEALGGEVTHVDPPDGGASFWVRLPCGDTSATAGHRPAASTSTKAP